MWFVRGDALGNHPAKLDCSATVVAHHGNAKYRIEGPPAPRLHLCVPLLNIFPAGQAGNRPAEGAPLTLRHIQCQRSPNHQLLGGFEEQRRCPIRLANHAIGAGEQIAHGSVVEQFLIGLPLGFKVLACIQYLLLLLVQLGFNHLKLFERVIQLIEGFRQ
jgi:hypothetical protein